MTMIYAKWKHISLNLFAEFEQILSPRIYFKFVRGWLVNFIPLSANIYPPRHAINQAAKKSESFIRTSRPRNCRRIHNYFLIKICFPLLSLPHFGQALFLPLSLWMFQVVPLP